MACAGLKIFVIRAFAQILPAKGQYNTESFKNFMPPGSGCWFGSSKKYFVILVMLCLKLWCSLVIFHDHIMASFYDCYFIWAMFWINLHSISSWWVADWLNISVYLELSLVKLWLSQAKTMPCSKSPLVKDSSSYLVWNMIISLWVFTYPIYLKRRIAKEWAPQDWKNSMAISAVSTRFLSYCV